MNGNFEYLHYLHSPNVSRVTIDKLYVRDQMQDAYKTCS